MINQAFSQQALRAGVALTPSGMVLEPNPFLDAIVRGWRAS